MKAAGKAWPCALGGAALAGWKLCQNDPEALEKLQYYCACIPDGFDTEDWPEGRAWETILQSV